MEKEKNDVGVVNEGKDEKVNGKITIDWKAPSINKMIDFMKTLSEDDRDEFGRECISLDNDKPVVDKKKAKEWLYKNYKDSIDWKNAPKNENRVSSADIIYSWIKKKN